MSSRAAWDRYWRAARIIAHRRPVFVQDRVMDLFLGYVRAGIQQTDSDGRAAFVRTVERYV